MSNEGIPDEVWTSERCFIAELLNNEQMSEVSVARARVEPGASTALHSLSVAEWYVIESGTGLMTVGKEIPRRVAAGDAVAIPRGVSQNIRNVGDCDLIFLCVCAPRFSEECYTSLE
jgi:mannose-6-phosphate isomerase-like protein (cupin superfamily)